MRRNELAGEGCGDRHDIYDREQAEGILKIHAPCEPPCPRKRAAMEYVEMHPPEGGR